MHQEGPVSTCACMSVFVGERERDTAFVQRYVPASPSACTFVYLVYIPVCFHSLVLSLKASGID